MLLKLFSNLLKFSGIFTHKTILIGSVLLTVAVDSHVHNIIRTIKRDLVYDTRTRIHSHPIITYTGARNPNSPVHCLNNRKIPYYSLSI